MATNFGVSALTSYAEDADKMQQMRLSLASDIQVGQNKTALRALHGLINTGTLSHVSSQISFLHYTIMRTSRKRIEGICYISLLSRERELRGKRMHRKTNNH
jgi:hypothetical protein